MARPRIFDTERCALNVYLHRHQFGFIKKLSHDTEESPSAIIRRLIDNHESDMKKSPASKGGG